MGVNAKILLVLALALLLAELAVRRWEPMLSKDVAHLRSLQRLPETLMPRGDARLLLLGNSLSRCALDLKALEVPGGGGAAVLYPDASSVVDWSQAFRRYVMLPQARPRWVLIGTGRTHLEDPGSLNLDRLAAWLVPPGERLAFLRSESLGMEQGTPFLLSSVSRLFANRMRVQPLLFYKAVPGYEFTARLLNEEAAWQQMAKAPSGEASVTTRHLERLLEDIAATGAQPVVVALPTPQRYELAREIQTVLAQRGVRLLDFGSRHDLPDARFPDEYHLDPEGAALFTQQLNAELRNLVP